MKHKIAMHKKKTDPISQFQTIATHAVRASNNKEQNNVRLFLVQ